MNEDRSNPKRGTDPQQPDILKEVPSFADNTIPEAPRSRKKNYGGKKKKLDRKYRIAIMIGIFVVLTVTGVLLIRHFIDRKMSLLETLPPEASFAETDVYVNPELFETEVDDSGQIVDRSETIREEHSKYTTIMLYGVDARNNHDLVQYANADTDIILVINNETKECKLVSVLRDTFLETTSGKHTKLTDIYAGYGVQESLQTINMCFDLQITKYVTVNWKMVAKAVNCFGGIDMQLTSSEVKYINSHLEETMDVTGLKSGTLENRGKDVYRLNGVQAVVHARNRSVGQHDLSRASRQQKVIKALLNEAKTTKLTDLNAIVDELLPGMSTNLSASEIISMAMDVKKYSIADTTIFPFEYKDQSNLRTAYVYCNTLKSNVTQLHEYLYGTQDYYPTSKVREISEYITEYRYEHP